MPNRRNSITCTCLQCGKVFQKPASSAKAMGGPPKFCSKVCHGKYRTSHRKHTYNRKPAICHPERESVGLGLCATCYGKQDRAKNKAKYQLAARSHQYRKAYGMSLEDYQDMFDAQGGKCAICLEPSSTALVVDHDHATGKVRQLLCRIHNMGLGQFNDSPELLRRAAEYLISHARD